MAKKKIIPSDEAYVYWFYNKYTFETYFGSRAAYEGSYKDDFMINYNSSSKNEKFLKALKNGELVGEVIAVFTGEAYEEVAYKAFLYEQELIYLSWGELGNENSYNQSCWYKHKFKYNPFYKHYLCGKDSPLYKDYILAEDVIRMNIEEKMNLCEIARFYGVCSGTIRTRFNEVGIEPITYMAKDRNGNCINLDIDKIIELTDKGYTVCEIAREMNVDPGLIHKRCEWYEIKKNPYTPLKGSESPNYIHFDFDEVVRLNTEEKLNPCKISEIIGISVNVICKRAKELGVKLNTYMDNENNGRWIDVDVEEIKKLAAEDNSIQEIADKLGFSYCVIEKRCKDNNIKTRKGLRECEHSHNYKVIDKDELLELHNQGWLAPAIANYFNTNPGLIRERLRALGVEPNKFDRHEYYSKHNPMAGVSLSGPANGRYVAIPYDELYDLRVVKKMSKDNIGKHFGCSGRVVNRRLKEYGIEI